MSGMDKLASSLYSALTESDKKKPKPYDTKAEVLRTEGNTVWVKIPGGIDETPVQRTNNANPGDTVMVRVAGGRAWLLGNNTSPATDDTRANQAYLVGSDAGAIADIAIKEAGRAQDAADLAEINAQRAQETADAVEEIATRAEGSALEAKDSALNASEYASRALDQLGVVEDVVGVLDLLSKNGNYQVTQDEEVQGGKWYFIRSGTSPNYVYEVVNNPTSVYHLTEDTAIDSTKTYYTRSGAGTEQDPYVYTEVESPVVADIGTYYEKYYELVGIDQSVQNYVSSQLVVTDAGLWLKRPDSTGIQTKVLLSATDGVVLYGTNGQIVGKYGQTAQVGDASGFHIEMDGTELGFYDGTNKVAYISNQQLYITQSVVLQQMDLGTMVAQGGLGQWSWKIHPNGDTPSRNNLNLKWVG